MTATEATIRFGTSETNTIVASSTGFQMPNSASAAMLPPAHSVGSSSGNCPERSNSPRWYQLGRNCAALSSVR